MQNVNVLKPAKSKLSMFIVYAIAFLLAFGVVTYITYGYNYYAYILGVATGKFDIDVLIASLGVDTTFIAEIFLNSLKMQITQLWWLHLIILLLIFVMLSSDDNGYKNIEHGSARFATESEKKRFSEDTTGIPCGKDFYVPVSGTIGRKRVVSNLNELVIGGSGSGKSFRKSLPDIMQMWGSYVITDPKGELFRNTYQLLKDNGYEVRVLNLIDISLSNSYNPFAYMETETDVLEICSLFIKTDNNGSNGDSFWSDSALDFFTAISVYLFKAKNEVKSFGRVIRLVNSVYYENDKISENCELARCLNRHSTEYPDDYVAISWNGLKNTVQTTMSGVQKTLSTRLRLWAVEDVDLLTSKDEMEFDKIGERKTAIFLIMPVPTNPYKAVANIFYSQLFSRLFKVADAKHNGRWKELISFELDEFANIGTIPDFEKILAVVRSYNIRVCVILQDLSQLKAMYKDTYEGIMANCAITTFLGTIEDGTLERFSKRLGNISVRTSSKSYNRTGTGGGSDTESNASRALLTPDEIREAVKSKENSDEESCIVWVGYERPFYMKKFDTLNHPMISFVGGPPGTPQFENNTDIREVYGKLFKAKKEAHLQLLAEKRTETEAEANRLQQANKIIAEQEQAELAELFNKDVGISPPSADDENLDYSDEFVEDEDTEYIADETYQALDEYEETINPVIKRMMEKEMEADEAMPE